MKDESSIPVVNAEEIKEQSVRKRDVKLQCNLKGGKYKSKGSLVHGKLSDFIKTIEKYCNIIELEGEMKLAC
jgi:hypothetical protein